MLTASRGSAGERVCQLERAVERAAGGDDLRHEPCGERLVGRQAPAEQNQLFGARRAEQARGAHGAARAGQDPDRHLREPEHGGLVGNPKVRRERQLEPAAEAVAVDRADRRLREGRNALVDASAPAVVAGDRLRVAVGELRDVGAGREGAPAAGEDEAGAVAHLGLFDRVAERLFERRRQCVQLLRPAKAEDAHVTLEAHLDERLAHRRRPLISFAAASVRRPISGRRSRGRRCSVPHTLTTATGRPCSDNTGAEAPKSDSSSSPTADRPAVAPHVLELCSRAGAGR